MRCATTLCVLIGLISASACGRKSPIGVSVDAEFRPLISADTKVLADVKLDDLKLTPLYQRHEKDLELPMLQDWSQRIGLDPRRDISEVLIAWNGKRALFLVRGKFKREDIEKKLGSLGVPRSAYKNQQVFGESQNSLAFVTKNVAVLGTSDDVRQAVDLESSRTGAIPQELEDRLRHVPQGDQVWIVSRGGLAFADMPMRSDMQSALSNIVNFITGTTLGLEVDTGTHLRIDITCISAQGAQRVHDALRGGIGFARLTTKDDQQQLLQLYDAVNVDQENAVVHVHADYSGELTDKLLQELPQTKFGRER